MGELKDYYTSNYKRMVKISYNVTKQQCDAEDVVQETFSRAIKYYGSFKPEVSSLHHWMNGILSRCIKDFQRDARLQGMSVEIKEEDLISGENVGEDNKTLSEIEGIINSIANLQNKQICYLHFIQGHTPREIVQVVDVSRNNASTVIHRFRRDLKVIYG